MKKLFTLFAFLAVFMGAKADEIVDAFVDFSQYKDISEVPRFGWGGSQEAWDRLSIQDGCLHFHSTEVPLNDKGEPTGWMAQWFPIGTKDAAEVGVTYTLHFKVKGDHAENISAIGFGLTPYGEFPITTDWVEGTYDYVAAGTDGNLLFQAGSYIGDFDIAYLKITHEGKQEKPATWKELLVNGDAEKSWKDLGLDEVTFDDMDNNTKVCFWSKEKGHNMNDNGGWDPFPAEIITEADGNHAFICRAQTADTEGDPSAWDNQIWIQSPRAWKAGEQFKLSFRYKASEPVKTNTQMHKQKPSDYLWYIGVGDVDFTTEWKTFEDIITVSADQAGMYSVAFNLNPKVKTPVDFYIDDVSWSEMELEHGLFVTGKNTTEGLASAADYDFDNAIEFKMDEDMDAMAATIGTKGKPATYVNEVMISTVRGNDRQYKANTIKTKGAIGAYDEDEEKGWVNFEEGANYKIKLPSQGVWTIYVDQKENVVAFKWLEGDKPKNPIEVKPNDTKIVINAVERDWLVANDKGEAQEEQIGEGQPWDNQFIIMANRPIKAGEVTIIEFDYSSKVDATTNTQCGKFGEAGGYVFWNALGDVNFKTEEQHFSKTYTVPGDADGMGAFNFNMAVMKGANVYNISNVKWYLEDMTESLIDMTGGKNFYIKTGAGTAPTPMEGDGIENITVKPAASNVIYNIAGQRVSNNYKGIVVKNGSKYIVK